MHTNAVRIGAFFAALAVILGAFGAHALKQILTPELLQTFETGVKYQFYHSFALLATGILYGIYKSKLLSIAATFFTVGIMLFSGSIYTLVMLKSGGQVGLGGLGILTPVGGLFFVAGWVLLLLGVSSKNKA